MPVDVLTRTEKGSKLTHAEMDQNLIDLQDAINIAKMETVRINTSVYNASSKQVILCDTSATNIAVILPDTTLSLDLVYVIKKIDNSTNSVTITGFVTGQNIEGNASYTLSNPYQKVHLICDGTEWFII